jgi:tRNA pseudouridine55 synthase
MAEGRRPGVEQRTGLVLVDKQAGPSSFGAIAALRPALGRKLGHAGTLDPFASGLLVVLAGRATRLATFLTGLDKRYLATVQFGARSTTDDPEGELTPGDGTVTEAEVAAALAAFRGRIRQVPPAASAIHVDGERAYARFRRGETVLVPARDVEILALELVAFDAARQAAEIDVHCSTGTYVRALARDLGDAVGTGAYCSALRRTAVGPFDVAEADGALRPAGDAVPHLPHAVLDAAAADAIRHGRSVAGASDRDRPTAVFHGDDLVAIARAGEGDLRPLVVL